MDVLLQGSPPQPGISPGDTFLLYIGKSSECQDVKVGERILVVGTPLQMHPETPGYSAVALKVAPAQAAIDDLRAVIRLEKL